MTEREKKEDRRDFIAALAMNGTLAHGRFLITSEGQRKTLADDSYKMADEMETARTKNRKEEEDDQGSTPW